MPAESVNAKYILREINHLYDPNIPSMLALLENVFL
jgi:hypothetical protein